MSHIAITMVNRVQGIQEKSGKILKEVELLRQKVREMDGPVVSLGATATGQGGHAANLRNMMAAAAVKRTDYKADTLEIRASIEAAIRLETEDKFKTKIQKMEEDHEEEIQALEEDFARERKEIVKKWEEEVRKVATEYEEELQRVKESAKLTVAAVTNGLAASLRESAAEDLEKRNSRREEYKGESKSSGQKEEDEEEMKENDETLQGKNTDQVNKIDDDEKTVDLETKNQDPISNEDSEIIDDDINAANAENESTDVIAAKEDQSAIEEERVEERKKSVHWEEKDPHEDREAQFV